MSTQTVPPAELTGQMVLPEGLGRPIKGPSAMGSDPRRLWQLSWTLAKTEFKLAFFGSALGYLWQLMRPLLLFGVIYLVLSKSVLASTNTEPYFPAALLLGIVLFNFFSESTGGAVTCMVLRENLVRKIEFPRLAVPLSLVLTSMMNLGLNLVPVVIFLLAAGASPHLSWLLLPVVLFLLALFSTGLGMILSVSYVRYRDIKPIWDVIMQMTFYASGIFISISHLSPITIFGQEVSLSHVLMCNPFAAILQESRHVFIDPAYPTAAEAIGGTALLMIPIGIGLVTLIGGFILFDRRAPQVAEQL